MEEFDYSEYCIKKLLERVPEIMDVHEPLKSWLVEYLDCKDNPDKAHGIYEGIVFAYFFELIKKNNPKKRYIVNKILELIEELAEHEDFEVRCVAKVSFVEPFLPALAPNFIDIKKYLLPKSLNMARDIGWARFGIDCRKGWTVVD